MIDSAISDYLGAVIRAWCSATAGWGAPGEASREVCDECTRSRFTSYLDLGTWPHSVAHPLITALNSVVADVQISLREEHDDRLEHGDWTAEYFGADHDHIAHLEAADNYVVDRVLAYYPLVHDVLAECVAPVIDEYVAVEVERGMLALQWG